MGIDIIYWILLVCICLSLLRVARAIDRAYAAWTFNARLYELQQHYRARRNSV